MKSSKPFLYCYLLLVLVNLLSFIIAKSFPIDYTGSKPSIWIFFAYSLLFLIIVWGAKKILHNKKVYLIVPLIVLIIKFLLISGDDMNGWDAVMGVSNFIFYPTSIISFTFKNGSSYWFDVCNYIFLVFLYELIVLKIFNL